MKEYTTYWRKSQANSSYIYGTNTEQLVTKLNQQQPVQHELTLLMPVGLIN